MNRLVIIGGGLSGLSAAYWAQRAGFETTVLESSSRFGGTFASLETDGFRIPAAEYAFENQPSRLLELSDEIGCEVLPHSQWLSVNRDGIFSNVFSGDLSLSGVIATMEKLGYYKPKKSILGRQTPSPAPENGENLKAFCSRAFGKDGWATLATLFRAKFGADSDLKIANKAFPTGSAETLIPTQGPNVFLQKLVESNKNTKFFLNTPAKAVTQNGLVWEVHTPRGKIEAEAVLRALSAPSGARLMRPTFPQFTATLNHFAHNPTSAVHFAVNAENIVDSSWDQVILDHPVVHKISKGIAPSGYVLLSAEIGGKKAAQSDQALVQVAQKAMQNLLGKKARPFASWVFRNPTGKPVVSDEQARNKFQLEGESVYAPGLFFTGEYLTEPGLAHKVDNAFEAVKNIQNFLDLHE